MEEFFRHLQKGSCDRCKECNALISGHPRWGNPRDIHGHGAGFVTLFHNLKPGMGGLDCFFYRLYRSVDRNRLQQLFLLSALSMLSILMHLSAAIPGGGG